MTQFTADVFQSHLNETFTVHVEGHDPIPLSLVEVDKRIDTERQSSFSIYFTGPTHVQLKQATFLISHDKLGELELFVVPVAQTEEYFKYESIFSLLKSVPQAS